MRTQNLMEIYQADNILRGYMVFVKSADKVMKYADARLREAGLLTLEESAGRLGVARRTVRTWQRNGLLRAHAANDKNVCLFEPPGENSPIKRQGRRRSRRRRFRDFAPGRTEEVQYAT